MVMAISARAAIRGREDMAAKLRAPRRSHIVARPEPISYSRRRRGLRCGGTFGLVRRHWPDALIVPASLAAALEAIVRRDSLPDTPAWVAAPVLALLVALLLARHRAP